MAQHDKRPSLKLGIAIDSLMQPRWVRKSIEDFLATGICTIDLVVRLPTETKHNSVLLNLYNRVDQRLYLRMPDAAELVGIHDLIDTLPSLDPESDKLKDFNLDVVINWGLHEWNPKLASAAKHGVWFYVFGRDDNLMPGVREIFEQDAIIVSSVRCVRGSRTETGLVYQCVAPTLSKFSAQLNNNETYWKAAPFLARGLVDLYNSRQRDFDSVLMGPNGFARQPADFSMVQLFGRLSSRAAARVVEKISKFEQWVLAYRLKQNQFRYLIPPADRFWADPFPLKVEDKYYIFFEDFVRQVDRGHISVIEVDQQGIVNGPTEVLKFDTHLSYPFVFEWQGEYYMVPETGAKNVVELYRSSSFPYSWEPVTTLLEARCPLDATIIQVSGTWWMFVNIQEDGVAFNWDELHLYYSESLFGPWKSHPRNPVVSDVRSARPAGRLFWSNDVLYRPSQDSSRGYGYATTINKITRLTPNEYSETAVGKILPSWDKDICGVHTVNVLDDITVIDCLTKRTRLMKRELSSPAGVEIVDTLLSTT